jgi:hypothetical protein
MYQNQESGFMLKGGYSLYFLIMTELDFSDLIYFEACTAA